jgi:hypothetical protein
MVAILRNVFCDKIVSMNFALVHQVHDARQRGGNFGQRGDVEYGLVGEGRRTVGQAVVGEGAERLAEDSVGAVGHP